MSENYVPLYRKYRPQTLDTLVGQEHVKKTLTSAIELGKIAHAFLFTGPRGTGKTSTARILAKSLNCKNGPTIHPCGECESCRDITNSVPIDVIEIDAASNRTVEDAQNILEKIQYVPVHGKYKIYIIDEIHMLSNHAFNALLKTLEEPPENVIFILATTEVHKVLDTIKSRCQRFDFRRITTEDIAKHLRYISDKENIKITDDALYTIAKNSAGGMRDSISLLDQLSLLGISKEITSDDVNSILGRISFDVLHKLSEKIVSSSPNDAIEILNEIYNAGNEPLQILTNLSEYFKNLLIVKNCRDGLLAELTGLNEPQIKALKEQQEQLETQQVVFLLDRITHYIKEVKRTSDQYLWLEVGMIDLANMTENSKIIDLQNRIRALETNGVSVSPQPAAAIKPAPAISGTDIKEKAEVVKPAPKAEQQPEQSDEVEFTPPPVSKKSSGNDIRSLWETLLANIKSPPTKALLNLATPAKISADQVVITFKNEKLITQFGMNNKKDAVAEAAAIMFNKEVPVIIRLPQSGDENAASYGETAEPEQESEKKNPEPVNTENFSEKEPQEFDTETDEPEIPKAPKNEKRLESDQEKMVLDLFDGKYID